MQRTTLILDESLINRVKKLAHREGRTLTEQIDLLLRAGLKTLSASKRSSGYTFNPPVVAGEMREGVDLSDRKSLYDLMDGLD